MTLPIVHKIADMQNTSKIWASEGARIGLVATMGALHAGHLSLIDVLAPYADKIIVSIFVNPAQFAADEDLDAYPRQEEQDCAALANTKADIIFMPAHNEIYPDGFASPIAIGGVALGLEAEHRPHFFGGVATIVAKLFLCTRADAAVFGEKDFQQLRVIEQMVRDLHFPTQIIPAPIIREADGLAMSSRNAYLTAPSRKIAAQLNLILKELAHSTLAPEAAEAQAHQQLKEAGFTAIDYATLRNAKTLEPITPATRKEARALIAARIGDIRLLDNMACL